MKRPDQKVVQALAAAEASLAVEGLYLTEEERSLILVSLNGAITHEEFLRLAKERANASRS